MPATAAKVNPFTPADLAIARQIVDSHAALTDFYRRCTNCKLDVNALQATIDALKDYAESVIAEFGDSGT